MKFAILSVLLLLIIFIALKLATPKLGKLAVGGIIDTDGERSLADCPDTPNCQSSEATRESQRVDRFVINNDPEQAIATLADIVKQQVGTQIVAQDANYLHATFSTPLMGYVDDVEFLLSEDDSSVQVRSASRLGHSDLGANAKRVEHLRKVASGTL